MFAYLGKDNIGAKQGSKAQRKDCFPGQRRPRGYARKLESPEEALTSEQAKAPPILQRGGLSSVEGSLDHLCVQLSRLFTCRGRE